MPGARTVFEQSGKERSGKRCGRFLLVNLNFNPANPGRRTDMVAKWQKLGKLATSRQVDLVRRWVDHKKRLMEGLQALLVEVARAGVFERIVLRPHPEENHDTWREWAAGVGGDIVFHYDPQSGANPWTLASTMMLHAGCTTGLEALLLDLPSVSFAPEPDSEFQNPADAVSARVTTAGEFLEQAKTWETSGDRARAIVETGPLPAPPVHRERSAALRGGSDSGRRRRDRRAGDRHGPLRDWARVQDTGWNRDRRRAQGAAAGARQEPQRLPRAAVSRSRGGGCADTDRTAGSRRACWSACRTITRVDRAVLRLQ